MPKRIPRRTMLSQTGGALAGALIAPRLLRGQNRPASPHGYVVGEPTAEVVGGKVLADGGNAFDAIVAAALTAAIHAPYQTGIGGYGGSATLSTADGKKIVALDFNSTAPAAARADMFKPAADGSVPEKINEFGWLATGVPGILAGLQLLLDRYGTKKFAELAQPAIAIARDGFAAEAGMVAALAASVAHFEKDSGSKKLYLKDGKPVARGETFRNPELAELLTTLANRGSVKSFYDGDIAQCIADGFQKNRGLVTAKDLAAYRAHEVEPLSLAWDDRTIYTAPLTAGGITVLQAFRFLEALRWAEISADFTRTRMRVEALRLAWRDRLTLLGDPEFARVPVEKLLSADYARDGAERILAAIKSGKLLAHNVTPRHHGGTINLSAADRDGNFIALTLTHGNSFGARVTVDGLGLTLGHGMSRFDPQPDHPNAPAPGKRPLHNMAPCIVTQKGIPVLAAGARGGRKIPNAMFELLTEFVLKSQPLPTAMAAPRIHTEGDAALVFEKEWPAGDLAEFRQLGAKVSTAGSATISAVGRDATGLVPAMR